jgi:BirA family transcriptional regulator, biotin operon repressor / biotin---[acetyl-CoA-carboxylase] ligase
MSEKVWLDWLGDNRVSHQGQRLIIPSQWEGLAREYGLNCSKGREMTWDVPNDSLQAHAIGQYIQQQCEVDIKMIIGSTHSHCFYLKDIKPYRVCLAEYQTQGRGRTDDPWISFFGENILATVIVPLTAHKDLTIKIAKAMAACLQPWLPKLKVSVKWPNDVMINDAKCLGIMVSEPMSNDSDCLLVSFGCNVNMLKGGPKDQAWTSLQKISGRVWDRNYVAGKLLQSILSCCQ